MVNTYDQVFNAALSLPPGLRAMLAEHLFKSLDTQNQLEIDTFWAELAEQRLASIEQGEVNLIPGEQVLRDLRNRG
ncbi:addiction module protein [Cuspidothrix issatschenkoi LEGE 03284]|uniref:addiction module protein n=1 Tax=Cuspidothrix issatschenkoi TaxID=230752 RepID=UPI00187F216D|nr:addiction module protein [Cuspidothrix issatschenkoi]MBE9232929.1 addiction module protein [Cuspidothrix issatschenkoi LEGE 03284]